MISFKDHLALYNKKYVSVQFTEETNANLHQFCEDNGFDISHDYDGNEISSFDFKFHTTVINSINKVILPNGEFEIPLFKLEPVKFELLGFNHDIPVLRVKSDMLSAYRKQYEDSAKLKDKWDMYKPHVSMSYKYKNIKGLKIPSFDIIVSRLIVEDSI